MAKAAFLEATLKRKAAVYIVPDHLECNLQLEHQNGQTLRERRSRVAFCKHAMSEASPLHFNEARKCYIDKKLSCTYASVTLVTFESKHC